MSKNDGGPAFPALNAAVLSAEEMSTGLTIRDWFAGQALASGLPCDQPFEFAAKDCYEMADAMLAERDKEARETVE